MKKIFAVIFVIMVMVTGVMAQDKDIPVIQVPEGQCKPVLLDGIMTPAEWDDALKVKIHERIDLLVKVNAGHLFLGLKFRDAAGVIVDLWLTSDDKTVYQMHSSGQLSEGVFKLPVKEDSIELSMGHTTDWDANEIKSYQKKKDEWVAAGRPGGMEAYRKVLYPSDGKEFQIMLSKFSSNTLKLRFKSGDPEGLVTYPEKSTLSDTDNWLELVLPEDFPKLTGPYLGQNPPGMAPEIFAPGIVSTGMSESAIAVSPDGKEIFYTIHAGNSETIVTTRLENGSWTGPEVASFSGKYLDGFPSMHPDGSKLYFHSYRPMDEGSKIADVVNIWYVEKKGNGWSEPKPIGPPINGNGFVCCPSVTQTGTLYYSKKVKNGGEKIYRSRFVNGHYMEPEPLPPQVNREKDQFHAVISPNESYLILPRENYLVSFRSEDDQWSDLISLGEPVNELRSGCCPSISSDGKYVFFAAYPSIEWKNSFEKRRSFAEFQDITLNHPVSDRTDIYWVDAKIIEELKPRETNSISYNGKIPSEFDWREKNIITPVKHQRNLGFCGIDDFWFVSGLFLFSAALPPDQNIRQVTTDPAPDYHVKWSPDGKTLAFTSQRSGEPKIWMVPAAGGDPVMLETGLSGDHHISWAPDSRRIVFDARYQGRPNIFTISLDGGKPKRLSEAGAVDFHPYWSPDGSLIAFASLRSGNTDIWIMPAQGGRPIQLTKDKAGDQHPVWSPDGSKIAFSSNRSGNYDIWIISASGGEAKQLTFYESRDDHVSWSPDGTRIAFMSERGGKRNIWIISESGGEPVRFTEESDNSWPSWSPDGKQIAFASTRAGENTDIWIKIVKKN